MASTTSLLSSKSLTINDLEKLFRTIHQALNCPGEPLCDSLMMLGKHYFHYLKEEAGYSKTILCGLLRKFKDDKSYSSKFDLEKLELILRDIEGNSENLKSLYEKNNKQEFIETLVEIKEEAQRKIHRVNLVPPVMTAMQLADHEGREYLKQKNWQAARRCFHEEIRQALELKNAKYVSLGLQNLSFLANHEGYEHYELKNWQEARKCFNKVLRLKQGIKDEKGESRARELLAYCISKQDEDSIKRPEKYSRAEEKAVPEVKPLESLKWVATEVHPDLKPLYEGLLAVIHRCQTKVVVDASKLLRMRKKAEEITNLVLNLHNETPGNNYTKAAAIVQNIKTAGTALNKQLSTHTSTGSHFFKPQSIRDMLKLAKKIEKICKNSDVRMPVGLMKKPTPS